MLEKFVAVSIGIVLLHAAYRDLLTGHIKDIHWILVAVLGLTVAVIQGHVIDALTMSVILGVPSAFLWLINRWGSGDALMLTALGTVMWPLPEVFGFVFLITAMLYLSIWKTLLGRKSRFVPVFLLSYVFTYLIALG